MRNFSVLLMSFALLISFSGYAERIAILSDVHVTPGNRNAEELSKAVKEINATDDIDLVVMNGDLTNEGSDEQLTFVKAILDSITHPLFVIPGNHEDTWSQSATKTFIDLWGNDRFITETPNYIIVGTNCGPFMKMGDGHVKQEDLLWLRSTLSDRVGKSGKKVISFNHYPLRKDDLDNYQDYIDVLEDFPTIIHINGHYHKFEHYYSGSIPSMMVRALDIKKNFGYTIVDIRDDMAYIYNKVLGEPEEMVGKFPLRNTSGSIMKRPRKIEFAHPDGFAIEKIFEDTASIFTRVGISDDCIYTGNSLGILNCTPKGSKNSSWNLHTGASLFARPIVAGNKLYVPSADKRMLILDTDGNLIKEFASEGPYVADGIFENGKVYVGGYKKFECYNPETGEREWVYDSLFNYCQASPVFHKGKIYFGAWDTNLRCLDADSGKLLWVWNNGKPANMLGPGNVVPVVNDSVVIIVAPDRFMTAIDPATGTTLWRDNSVRYRESLGVSNDGTKAFAKTMDGELVCVEASPKAFNMLWKTDMELGYEHAPCIVAERDGVIYAGSRRGLVTAVDAATHKVLWSLPLGSSEVNGIDLDPFSDDVYVSLIEGLVWKISKK